MDKEFYLRWFRTHADWLTDSELNELISIAHNELMDREYDEEAMDSEYEEGFASDLEIGFDPYLGCYTDDC